MFENARASLVVHVLPWVDFGSGRVNCVADAPRKRSPLHALFERLREPRWQSWIVRATTPGRASAHRTLAPGPRKGA